MLYYFGLQFCNGLSGEDLVCRYEPEKQVVQNKHLCLPQVYLNMILNDTTQYYPKLQDYNKFDLPFPNEVNPIDIGIDITDVLRINDKVRMMETSDAVLFRV